MFGKTKDTPNSYLTAKHNFRSYLGVLSRDFLPVVSREVFPGKGGGWKKLECPMVEIRGADGTQRGPVSTWDTGPNGIRSGC